MHESRCAGSLRSCKKFSNDADAEQVCLSTLLVECYATLNAFVRGWRWWLHRGLSMTLLQPSPNCRPIWRKWPTTFYRRAACRFETTGAILCEFCFRTMRNPDSCGRTSSPSTSMELMGTERTVTGRLVRWHSLVNRTKRVYVCSTSCSPTKSSYFSLFGHSNIRRTSSSARKSTSPPCYRLFYTVASIITLSEFNQF